jgi:hypothetical protein
MLSRTLWKKESKMKVSLTVDSVIDYLVASYRERLEDDGDLLANEFQENINNLAKAKFDHGNDVIVLSGDIEAVNEILPSVLSNQIENQLGD